MILNNPIIDTIHFPKNKYQDRAKLRRQENPESKNQFRTLESIPDTPLESMNVVPPLSSSPGYQLLKKMGWKESNGLGKYGNGILNPIEVRSSFEFFWEINSRIFRQLVILREVGLVLRPTTSQKVFTPDIDY